MGAEQQRAKTARHEQPRQQRCDERGDGERDEEPERESGVVPAEHPTHGTQLEDVASEHDLHPAEVRLQEQCRVGEHVGRIAFRRLLVVLRLPVHLDKRHLPQQPGHVAV